MISIIMDSLLLFLFIKPIYSTEEENCWTEAACLEEKNNLILTTVASSIQECQNYCSYRENCNYFTYYGPSVTPSLASACLLFSNCRGYSGHCRGCWSGPRNCSYACHLPDLQGGIWSCAGNNTDIRDFERCIYTCATRIVQTVCLRGKWSVNMSELTCPCSDPPYSPENLNCSDDPTTTASGIRLFKGGSTCYVPCRPDEVAKCFNRNWTINFSSNICSDIDNEQIVVPSISGLVLILCTIVIAKICKWRKRATSNLYAADDAEHVIQENSSENFSDLESGKIDFLDMEPENELVNLDVMAFEIVDHVIDSVIEKNEKKEESE